MRKFKIKTCGKQLLASLAATLVAGAVMAVQAQPQLSLGRDTSFVAAPAKVQAAGQAVQLKAASLINDGSFEDGRAWTEDMGNGSGCGSRISNFSAASGAPAAYDGKNIFWAGGYCGNTASDGNWVEQSGILVPVADSTLHFWIYSKRVVDDDPDAPDIAYLAVDGDEWTRDLTMANDTSDWLEQTVDLSAYAGQSITLRLGAHSEGSDTGNLFFDYIHFGSADDSSEYCEVTSTSTEFGIDDFSTTGGVDNISNLGTGPGGYTDYSSQYVSQYPGDSIDFSIQGFESGLTYGFGIWVDWNGNGSFDDAGEHVYNSGTYLNAATGTITVPPGTPPGDYRMRVVAHWLATSPTPCGNLGHVGTEMDYGEAEDYTFVVLSGSGSGPSKVIPAAVLEAVPVTEDMCTAENAGQMIYGDVNLPANTADIEYSKSPVDEGSSTVTVTASIKAGSTAVFDADNLPAGWTMDADSDGKIVTREFEVNSLQCPEAGGPVDPQRPTHVTPVPTLGQWGLMLMAMLLAGLGLRRIRRAHTS